MPSEVIQCITHIGQEQGMPDSLTFAEQHGNEIEAHIHDINHEDDKSYQPPDDATNEHHNDDFSFDDTNTHDSDDDSDDDYGDAPGVALNDDKTPWDDNGCFNPPVTVRQDIPSYNDTGNDQQQHYDDKTVVSSSTGSQHIKSNTASIIEPGKNAEVDLDLENTRVDSSKNTGVNVLENQGHELTESEHFKHAMELG